MRLSEYASTRKTRGSYKMPRSVQQSIPIDRIYADGVWQSGNVFSLMWQISDINYAMQSDAAKQNILTQLGTVYAGIPADCWMQVCIVSQRMDEKAFARDVLYHRENDGFDALRAERNRQIKANARENGNVVQHKYIIVSTNKPGVKEARERFVQVQGHLLSAFSALECAVTPLDNRARLEVLHKFFRISEEGRFNFDFDNCAKLGQDFRDSIAPDCIRFCKKHIEIEDFYAKCMTISEYPQQLDDKFISALLQQVPYIVLSIDIEPGVILQDDGTYRPNDVPVKSMQDYWQHISNSSNNEGNIYNASFVKLREVQLSYSFPRKWFKSFFVKSLDLGFEARNLWIIKDHVPHIDPEANFFGPSQIGGGVEFNSIPSTRSFGFNLRLTL